MTYLAVRRRAPREHQPAEHVAPAPADRRPMAGDFGRHVGGYGLRSSSGGLMILMIFVSKLKTNWGRNPAMKAIRQGKS